MAPFAVLVVVPEPLHLSEFGEAAVVLQPVLEVVVDDVVVTLDVEAIFAVDVLLPDVVVGSSSDPAVLHTFPDGDVSLDLNIEIDLGAVLDQVVVLSLGLDTDRHDGSE